MASVVPTGGGKPKVIYAYQDYVKMGEGVSRNFGFTKHVAICATIGIGAGLVYKTWHWNEKRYVAQYYADLAKKESRQEAERQTIIKAKFAQLEQELLA